jgi:penicillin-binding protein 1A
VTKARRQGSPAPSPGDPMLSLVRFLTSLLQSLLALPVRALQVLLLATVLNPRLGPLRHLATALMAYAVFALVLVYAVAPLRGVIGAHYEGHKLRYDAERWLATAVYDARGHFVGVFDPRLDSQRDVNYTDAAIEMGDYVANPDHKSIPVREVPEHYWRCLLYHEDRYLGSWLNPYGIDLLGVLKIPYSTVTRSIAARRPALGVGGSTLPMQFARVIYKTPPDPRESGLGKLRRKLGEWWLAPVIYHELTRGGDDNPLRAWAANHIWLAQRTGGAPLHGVEVTARIVFGKEAKDLSVAEQYVLASAVNKPIILLTGNERLNAVRTDRWKYITEVRARVCAERLISDPEQQHKVAFELFEMAGGPPDPRVKPKLQQVLDRHAPDVAKRAQANPITRANALLPAARFAIREEMKQTWGLGWRENVRAVTTTLDVDENLALRQKLLARLGEVHGRWKPRLDAGWTLDPAALGEGARRPNVIVAAADAKGEIVRYFDLGELAAYTGSPSARDRASGHYDAEREGRRIASTGKAIVAIALANEGRDTLDTLWTDDHAPTRGLEACDKGKAPLVRGRKAVVAFACSLNRPVEWRAAQLGQARIRRLIDGFGLVMPPAASAAEETPPSTAVVRGLVRASPQRVHHMSAVILAALTGKADRPVRPPSLVRRYEYVDRAAAAAAGEPSERAIVPRRLIAPRGRALLKALLQAPLCYRANGRSYGTLAEIQHWCAERRPGLALHFAKTGTDTTDDPSATVDAWITGGLQLANGAAYSYVVVVGTGSTSAPWARNLHAGQVAAPLLDVLLADLEALGKRSPASRRSPAVASAPRAAATVPDATKMRPAQAAWRDAAFPSN